MEAILSYVLISSICLSVCYLGFLMLQRNEMKLKHLRFYLLMSMLLAIVLPLSKVQIETPSFLRVYETTTSAILNTPSQQDVNVPILSGTLPNAVVAEPIPVRWDLLLFWLYSIVAALLILRLLFHLLILFRLYMGSVKQRWNDVSILINPTIQSPFSFFKWVFLTDESINEEILAHEKVHASQYHSLDLILVELLSAVMWFNPFIWMMKKSVQLVHEYLADEGVLRTGIDRLQYQALLVNQVAEEKFICLSSGFHHSLLKKRLIMMTKIKPNQDSTLRILTLVPIALFLFIGVACINGQDTKDQVTTEKKSTTTTDNKQTSNINAKSTEQQENNLFVLVGDNHVTMEEYEAIDPTNIKSISVTKGVLTEFKNGEILRFLRKKGLYQEYISGKYNGFIDITLKDKLQQSNSKEKFAGWFTEKFYNDVLIKDHFFVLLKDKHLTKEAYLDIAPSEVDSIKISGGKLTPKEKERIQNFLKEKGLYQEYTTGKYSAVVTIILKKK